MKLVGHWKQLWKAWSARLLAVCVAAPVIVSTMPAGLHAALEPYVPMIMWIASIGALIARPIAQQNIQVPPK